MINLYSIFHTWPQNRNYLAILSTNLDQEDSDDDSDSNEIELSESSNASTKRRRSNTNLTYVFPSNRCIDLYLEDASYLNLRKTAKMMLEKDQGDVVTVGYDDFTKAAGYGTIRGKADHITINGPNKKRTILTTGFSENIGHSGAEGAQGYEYKLKCLAVLGGCSFEDIKTAIDFWMSDRAGDCATFLESLDVENEKVLKCCAHLILGVDHACDKVFKSTEQKIGVQKLLNLSAGDKAFSSGSSIHTLGQIAIAKLLSPSHASHSVSLFNEYKQWMDSKGMDHHGFRGFVANRFGRIAENAKEFNCHKECIMQFFYQVVDSNANKLVLAVSTYIQNEWFSICSETYTKVGDILIFPMMDVFGIDKHEKKNVCCESKKESETKNPWKTVKDFFSKKLPEVKCVKDNLEDSGPNQLLKAVLEESLDTLHRQLSEMPFFTSIIEDNSEDDALNNDSLNNESKLLYAPISNLGCESEIAWLDNRLKMSGGTTSVTTLSRKKVISTNSLLTGEDFPSTNAERRHEWKWARTSNEVKTVKLLNKDFLETVKSAKRLSLKKKEELKKKKSDRLFKLLDICKLQGGPITASSLDIVNEMDEKQLLHEISYLRATVAPNIRQQRRIKVDGRFRMEKFSKNELITEIKNAVKPETEMNVSIQELLKTAFVSQ